MITDEEYSELFQTGVYPELLGVHDYITLGYCITQQEEETMNDNLNTPEFKPVPVKLTDAEVEKLLATKELYDGTVAYLTDADETADQPSPTLH